MFEFAMTRDLDQLFEEFCLQCAHWTHGECALLEQLRRAGTGTDDDVLRQLCPVTDDGRTLCAMWFAPPA